MLKEIPRRVTFHTLAYRCPDAILGEYTTTDMAAGDTVFGDHEELVAGVPKLLESTENAVINNVVHPMVLAARFHGYFEYLHPLETVMAERDDSSVIISFCGLVIHSSLFLPIVARNTFLH